MLQFFGERSILEPTLSSGLKMRSISTDHRLPNRCTSSEFTFCYKQAQKNRALPKVTHGNSHMDNPIRLLIKRELRHQAIDLFAYACKLGIVFMVRQYGINKLGYPNHFVFLQSAGGDCCRTQTDTRSYKR